MGQSTTSGAPNGNCPNYLPAPQSTVVQNTYQWTRVPKCYVPMIQPTPVGVVEWHTTHSTTNHGLPMPHPKWLCHPCRLGDPHRFRVGGKSEVAHKRAKWLCHPCRLGDPHRFRAGGKIRSGPLVGKVATSPLPSRGYPPLQSGGQDRKWPTCGQGGYVTLALSGIPTAAELR